MKSLSEQIIVAGIGNAYRRDDGVGVAIAEAVAAAEPFVHDVGPIGEPLDLLGKWDYAALAVVIDATRSGVSPGTIVVSELTNPSPQRSAAIPVQTSTHGLGLMDVLRLAEVLGAAPRRVVLVGIEGRSFGDGTSMCVEVERSVPKAIDLVIQLIGGAR
jgi:hydrogenase maturation protease